MTCDDCDDYKERAQDAEEELKDFKSNLTRNVWWVSVGTGRTTER